MTDKKFECGKCHRRYVSLEKLDEHVELYHELNIKTILDKHHQQKENTMATPIIVRPVPKGSKAFKCDQEECDFESDYERMVKKHKTEKHGAPPSAKSTVYRRILRNKVSTQEDATPSYKDLQGLSARMVKENQKLSRELTTALKDKHDALDQLAKAKVQYSALTDKCNKLATEYAELKEQVIKNAVTATEPPPAKGLHGELAKLRLFLDGDSNGDTPEARMGFKEAHRLTVAANAELLEQLKQAKQGLIPDWWLSDIKTDLTTSINMIVESIKESAKDSAKIKKYDELVKMLSETA